ncbi:hypothetical protein V8F33_004867 [Rhypophila sp. PSN 637]
MPTGTSLYEHYLDKGKAMRNDVSSAVNRLRKGLAVDSGSRRLSDRIQSLTRAETLQIMCFYMETIDHLTDDFASQLVSPISTNQKVLFPDERACFREGFLAYQALCLLSKEHFHPHWYSFTGRLSPLEIERIHAIKDYLFNTWVWIMIDGFERTNRCKARGSFLERDGCFLRYDLAESLVSGGIATLGRELDPTRPSWTEFDYDDGRRNNLRDKCRPDFDEPAPPRPKLSPGEEERQDRQITPLWLPFKEEVKTKRIGTWGKLGRTDQMFKMIKPDDPSLSHDGYFNCQARGWVFLNPDTFETVQDYWNTWIRESGWTFLITTPCCEVDWVAFLRGKSLWSCVLDVMLPESCPFRPPMSAQLSQALSTTEQGLSRASTGSTGVLYKYGLGGPGCVQHLWDA